MYQERDIKMETIIVNKAQLAEKLSQAKDGDLIELTIISSQNDCGNYSPAFLHLASIHNRNTYEDLEGIDDYLADFRAKEIA